MGRKQRNKDKLQLAYEILKTGATNDKVKLAVRERFGGETIHNTLIGMLRRLGPNGPALLATREGDRVYEALSASTYDRAKEGIPLGTIVDKMNADGFTIDEAWIRRIVNKGRPMMIEDKRAKWREKSKKTKHKGAQCEIDSPAKNQQRSGVTVLRYDNEMSERLQSLLRDVVALMGSERIEAINLRANGEVQASFVRTMNLDVGSRK